MSWNPSSKAKLGKRHDYNGAGVIPVCQESKKILLGYRSKDSSHPHKWELWGGGRKKDEIPRQTAIREFIEETRYTGPIDSHFLMINQRGESIYYTFVAYIDKKLNIDPNWEHSDHQWFHYDDIVQMDNLGVAMNGVLSHSEEKFKQYI